MSTEEQTDTLKIYWDHFFKAETGTYEKSTWLDLFLAEFLIRLNEGADPKELIKFCPVSGVVTLVGCELLCGIHRVTSSINSHCSMPVPPPQPRDLTCSGKETSADTSSNLAVSSTSIDGDNKPSEKTQFTSLFSKTNAQSSAEILRRYLLGGVAWRCLVLLRALGVEGLSCCRQLSSVLIWLFGEVSGATPTVAGFDSPARPLTPRTPIHLLFSHKIWSKQKHATNAGSKGNSPGSSERGSTIGRSRLAVHIKSESADSKSRRKIAKHSEHSSDSAASNDDLQILNRSLTIKISSPNDDFQYFNSPLRSPSELPSETLYSDPFVTPKKSKPKPDNYMNDEHRKIINSEITPFEFTLIIIDLLQELCKTESSLSGSEGSQISMQCINFSLRNLCSLQFGSVPTENPQVEEVAKLKMALTELLIVSLDKVLIHSDLCAKLINNGILPMLLRILEDVISKSSAKYRKDDSQSRSVDVYIPNKTESENLLKFVFGIAYAITAFFHCLLMQCRTVDKLREFTDQFKLYGECLKGGLLKECIELMIRIPALDRDESTTLIKKLIEAIGRLVCGMKRVRSEVIHSAACPRGRHKACRARVLAGMHHHHDILGEPSAPLPGSSACCIALLYGTLTSLVTDDEITAEPALRNKLLKVMLNSGVCCCFSPTTLMERIVRLMLSHNGVATLCLQLLEHTVYGELGASILLPKVTDQLPCSICEPSDEKRDFIRKYCPYGIAPIEKKNLWAFLIHYNSLLQLDNHNNVLHATVSHLLRITPKCRTEMKYELLFSVIYPTFIVAKHRYILRTEESAYFLTVSCLNIFASLLNTVSFAEQFIQKGGLSYVLELVSLSEFSNQCCSILEIAIAVEILKLAKEPNQTREVGSLASVQMLFESLSNATDDCFKIFELKLSAEEYEELSEERADYEAFGVVFVEGVKCGSSDRSVVSERCIEGHVELLKKACRLWRACAELCLCSPLFRCHAASQAALPRSVSLLRMLLRLAAVDHVSATELRVHVRIIEALITVHFAVADVTHGRSKELSCDVIRKGLASPAALASSGSEGGALRPLCEALIRVATARPSTKHTMPVLTHAKVPPLLCPSGGSSPGSSSSEESLPAVYASEHSDRDHSRPDDGYEADVEIGKLDLTSYKMGKLAESMSSAGNSPEKKTTSLVECGAYERGAELAHPELCLVVFDVLTQLIEKLVSPDREPAERARLTAACLSAARACCSRLSPCARAPPPAAAPPLLARLLSPATAALLSTRDDHAPELQTCILELIHVLASRHISARELSALLRLFGVEKPPLRALLTALERLVMAAPCDVPDYALTFPVQPYTSDSEPPIPEEAQHAMFNQQADVLAKKLRDAHLAAGVQSAWSRHAARATLGAAGGEAGWAPWLAGFSLLLQLMRPGHRDDTSECHDESTCSETTKQPGSRRESPVRADVCAHIISVGHESLMFEIWLEVATGIIRFRLTRPELGGQRVVAEERVTHALPARDWLQLAVNVQERLTARRMHVQVTMYVNGCEWETILLPMQGVIVRKSATSTVLLGESVAGVFHLSRAHVYRSSVMSAAFAMHLAAHPVSHSCHVKCESPNYSLLLTPNLLDTKMDWDQVYEMSKSTLRDLHDHLLLTFSARSPHIFNIYYPTSAPTVFGGRGAAGGAGAAAGGRAAGALRARWAGAASAARHAGLAPALLLLGGAQLLLYLTARVVELEGSAEEQATALSIALRSARIDSRLYASMYDEHGEMLAMLLTIFAASRCKVTEHILKAILDAACSTPLLTINGTDKQCKVTVCERTEAVLLEPRLLLLLTRAWRHLESPQGQEITWEAEGTGVRSSGSAWALTLHCICLLLRDEHPRRAFNHYQMNRVDLLGALLLACKERYLSTECEPMEQSCSSFLVRAARGLLHPAPALQRLTTLADFLLLMHQASDTFVTHSRANFYFLLTPEPLEKSEFGRKPSRRSRRRGTSRGRSNKVSESSEADSVGSSAGASGRGAEGEEFAKEHASHSKEMKGIINMQIKESRKHKISSTSENSDVTMERSDEGGGEERLSEHKQDSDVIKETSEQLDGQKETSPRSKAAGEAVTGAEDDLTDYIVVDVDEVNHETVDVYTGTLYQQKRVRAGASPGWTACEGLLLLLRDCLRALPDHAAAQWGVSAVSAETLIVLGNHRAASVRAAAVRAFSALRARALAATPLHHYMHLANQISAYEGSWELATACAELLTKCDVPLEDQLDDEVWSERNDDWTPRAAPLLALLPRCLSDVPLAHNITLIIRRVIDKAPVKALHEIAVAEVLVRCVRASGRLPARDGEQLLQEDLHRLLAALVLRHHYTATVINDLHHMLTHVEQCALQSDAEDAHGVVRAARDAQIALFHAQLDHLEQKLHSTYTAHTKYANYFTTVLSSAVSLGAEGAGRAERAELGGRHAATLWRAVSFLLSRPPTAPLPSPAHAALADRLLATLLLAVSGSTAQRPKWWVSSADWVTPLQELFWWVAAPGIGTRALQPALLRALYRAPPQALQPLTVSEPGKVRKLAVYLLTMLKHIHLSGSNEPLVELPITDWARGWAVGTQAGLPERRPSDALLPEAAALLRQDMERWRRTTERNASQRIKAVWSRDALAAKLTESAMSVTRRVVELQNSQRKIFMEHLRRAHAQRSTAAQRWHRAVDDYTHERGVFYEPHSYPQSWQLDPTEGPGRVRVRLRRAHLRIPPKFLKPEQQYKAEICERPPPLHSVLSESGGARGDGPRLHPREAVAHMARVTRVSVQRDAPGELLLSERSVHFVPETEEDGPAHSWPLERLERVVTRRWCLQERAVELFLNSGHAQLLAFADTSERDAFVRALALCHLPAKIEPDTLADAMSAWRNGSITNWEYLMRLNGLGGRSYNDLMQYPVFPFVVADYCSRILDLNEPASFRDLAKPMAIQNKNREQHYIKTYNDLAAARREGCSPVVAQSPHHYASLYSNSGGVLHYLVRLPPFTELFLNYQDNNFDMPDRTFHSMITTWRLITNDSPTDVKELIPELFYLPELFYNNEGLQLGVRQCGAAIDNVELPAWAADARMFTLAHRQALEAAHVTERLPQWVDLVFGYKQTGQAAIDAINVFPACTYYGFDPTALEDAVDRTAAADMVRMYGQAPRQLLRTPHPHRAPDLLARPLSQAGVSGGVSGLRWGRYCGSPALPAPALCARRPPQPPARAPAAVQALPMARTAALLPPNSALFALSDTHGYQNSQSFGSMALLSWAHPDDVVRLKTRRDAAPEMLFHVPDYDRITCVTTICTATACPYPVFVGYASGRVTALRLARTSAAASEALRGRPLLAHSQPVAALHACPRAALLVTASSDGSIVLWDLNTLTYIRTLPNRHMLPVTHATISATLGDVATAHDPRSRPPRRSGHDDDAYEHDADKYKSLLRVHTVNASFVGSVKVPERIYSVCYSSAAEGVSVNSVACALETGAVVLYSSWDLTRLATIPAPRGLSAPLLSIAYSPDSQVLFGCYADGTGAAWDCAGGSARLLPALAAL
ncbi:lysosomal-trafficking regulator [Amyelois transitella]|uniref:lysosomal-trafficking regulator n=1 Tax=Amyelois transitella TaxID=680683 RepID=UPI0029900973|nr:lysosomal-trafficking regulator [Amyelois transitella]